MQYTVIIHTITNKGVIKFLAIIILVYSTIIQTRIKLLKMVQIRQYLRKTLYLTKKHKKKNTDTNLTRLPNIHIPNYKKKKKCIHKYYYQSAIRLSIIYVHLHWPINLNYVRKKIHKQGKIKLTSNVLDIEISRPTCHEAETHFSGSNDAKMLPFL